MMYVPIKEAIANLQSDLAISTNAGSVDIMRWIFEAVSELDVGMTIITTKEVKIRGCKLAIPKDYISLDMIYLVGSDNECTHVNFGVIDCCIPNACGSPYSVERNVNHFYFSSNVDGKFKKAKLRYYSAPLDEDGLPLVPMVGWQAISRYVDWKYLKQKRNMHRGMKDSRANPIPQSEVDNAMIMWHQYHDEAKSKIGGITPAELPQIMNFITYETTTSYPPAMRSRINHWYRGAIR